MIKYFYKLGHCQDLSTEEYVCLTKDKLYQTNNGWLIGNFNLNVNVSGGLVFGGQLLSMHDKFNDDEIDQALQHILTNFQSQTGSSVKKIGLVLPKKLQNLGLNLAKKAGFKKVNVSTKLPNFGSWKSTKNWIILFEFENQLCFGQILSFSNQEFWSFLDQDLPYGDIEQGIMNLKLARSLLNLTEKKNIWDPFCGQGRLMVAGYDQKNYFINSDITSEFTDQVINNYEKASKIWHWGHKFLHITNLTPPKFITQKMDARQLSDFNPDLLSDISQMAIVTEGHLGKNFQQIPTVGEIQTELNKLFELWRAVLSEADTLKIPEIIFCLPLYLRSRENGDKWIWPKFEDKLIAGTKYKLQTFANGKKNILYAREQGFVGHLIIKLVL